MKREQHAGHTSSDRPYKELPRVTDRPAVGGYVAPSRPIGPEDLPAVPAGPAQGAMPKDVQ